MDLFRELFLMQQTYATLFSLANKVQISGDKYLENLTSRQYMVMLAIGHLPEDETTLNNIAKKLGTTKQNVKQMVTVMERKGYISIVPSQRDKRSVNISITEEGKQTLLIVAEKGVYFLAELFKDFSTEEMDIMWSLLKKLYRFDGEEQDGFEEESNIQMGENQNEVQMRVLKEFERRRIQSRNGGVEL